MIKEARSTVDPSNLDEMLRHESAGSLKQGGQQQYFTPQWLVQEISRHMPKGSGLFSLCDPQCGVGNLLGVHPAGSSYRTGVLGMDVDQRCEDPVRFKGSFVQGHFPTFYEVMDDLVPDHKWDIVVANPPFGRRWKTRWGIIDSTLLTWQFMTRFGRCGALIGNERTLKRLGITEDPRVYRYREFSDVWKDCEVVAGVLWWVSEEFDGKYNGRSLPQLEEFRRIMREEHGGVPEFNVWMDKTGLIRTYLSTRARLKRKLKWDDINRLSKLAGSTPMSLTTDRYSRDLLRELTESGAYKIEPATRRAIDLSLKQAHEFACPIMPITDFEATAYADEEDHLTCIKPFTHVSDGGPEFTPGKRYEIRTSSYTFSEQFTRKKIHCHEDTGEMYTAEHNCELTGQDRMTLITDDKGKTWKFMDRPKKANELPEALLWSVFRQPIPQTVDQRHPEAVKKNLRVLESMESLGNFTFYRGQKEYLSKVAVKNQALIAASTGCGKSAMALALITLKAPVRTLLIAPQGTMRSSDDDEGEEYQASQWVNEIQQFAPFLQVFQLFGWEDLNRIRQANGGELPAGVYISYYQALFQNGARETRPASWDDLRLADYMGLDAQEPDPNGELNNKGQPIELVKTIGTENDQGIRCIVKPCMATMIGGEFDCVIVDEAHYACNLSANLTQMMLRLQPKYRYALTATPIPNIVSNIFSLMGWLCVDNWYLGNDANPAWPFTRDELGRFEDTFLAKERDYTQEEMARANNPDFRGKCVKKSPVISSPSRLLKLLKPTMAYISKRDCNPELVKCTVHDIRVPMGLEQSKLYAHFLQRANVPHKNPLVRARVQISYLRAICAAPASFQYGGPEVSSNFNAKTVAILQLVAEILHRREQVVIVSSRVGQTNELHKRLEDAGCPVSRIDSTVSPDQQNEQSALFKSGKSYVHLMGIRCAVGHSYPDCPNLIVGSLEYSSGSKEQAEGRVYRVNSTRDINTYCVLHSDTIEEAMFDVVATKKDAATICLHGQRLPREYRPVEMSEILATASDSIRASVTTPETESERGWPKLRQSLIDGVTVMRS